MRMQKVGGSAERTRFNIDFYNQWRQIRGGFNWYECTLVNLYFEYNQRQGNVEFHAGLLGFVAIITYVYDFTFIDAMSAMKDDIEKGLTKPSDEVRAKLGDMFPGMTVEDPFGALDKFDKEMADDEEGKGREPEAPRSP